MKYWVMRNSGPKGPFSDTQIEGFIQAGRLPDGVQVSESQDGPWEPFTIVNEDADVTHRNELWDDLSRQMDLNAVDEALAIIDELGTFDLPAKEKIDLDTLRRSLMAESESNEEYADDDSYVSQPRRRSKKKTQQSDGSDDSGESRWMWMINPVNFLSGPIYQYTNPDFPSLAAAIRYYALIAKITYYILRIIWCLYAVFAVISVPVIFVSGVAGSETSFFLSLGIVVGFAAGYVVFLLVFGIAINLFLILSLASCELIAVFLKIERNTRVDMDVDVG
jgi:uncharacterized membrane protein